MTAAREVPATTPSSATPGSVLGDGADPGGDARPAGIVVALSGALTADRAHDWELLVHRIWAESSRPVSLDLSAVTLLSCPAVHAIVRVAAGARHRGFALHLHQVPPQAHRLLHWAHLSHLIASRIGAPPDLAESTPRKDDRLSDGPRSWAGLPRTATTAHGTVSTEQLQTALHRSAIGDPDVERAAAGLAAAGPSLLRWLTAGLITLERDIDDRGGGWWAEVAWADLNDAIISRVVPATPAETARVRSAVLLSGRAPVFHDRM